MDFPFSGIGAFDATQRVGPACWDRFDLFHVRSGRMALRLMGKASVSLPAGCGVLIYPHTPFEGDTVTPRSVVAVQHFSMDEQASALPPLRRWRGKRRGYFLYNVKDIDDIERDIERMVEWRYAPASRDTHALREAMMTLILGQIASCRMRLREPADHDVLRDVCKWVTDRPDRAVSLDEMARRAGWSVSHFRAQFRKRYGLSPGRFVRETRLREAARRIRQTREPIKRIAQRLGFTDLPNFYRAFRTAHGLTPAAYRRRHAPRG